MLRLQMHALHSAITTQIFGHMLTWCGYRPDPNSVRPYPNSVRPYPNSVRPDPNSVRPYPNSVRPDPNSVRPYPNSVRPYPNSVRPYPNSVRPYPNSVHLRRLVRGTAWLMRSKAAHQMLRKMLRAAEQATGKAVALRESGTKERERGLRTQVSSATLVVASTEITMT
jgi:hypothetical protein